MLRSGFLAHFLVKYKSKIPGLVSGFLVVLPRHDRYLAETTTIQAEIQRERLREVTLLSDPNLRPESAIVNRFYTANGRHDELL